MHYVKPSDARLQDILLAIQTGSLLSDPNRMRMTSQDYYLRSPEEMARLFADIPEALSNTLLVAERCNLDLSFKGYHLPHFEVPEGFTAQSYLRMLCEEGLHAALRRPGRGCGCAPAAGVRAGHHPPHGLRHLLPDRVGPVPLRAEHGIWYNVRGSGTARLSPTPWASP